VDADVRDFGPNIGPIRRAVMSAWLESRLRNAHAFPALCWSSSWVRRLGPDEGFASRVETQANEFSGL